MVVINSTKASEHDMKCLTRYAIRVIAMIIIRLSKYKLVPVTNNARAAIERNKIFTLMLTEVLPDVSNR